MIKTTKFIVELLYDCYIAIPRIVFPWVFWQINNRFSLMTHASALAVMLAIYIFADSVVTILKKTDD